MTDAQTQAIAHARQQIDALLDAHLRQQETKLLLMEIDPDDVTEMMDWLRGEVVTVREDAIAWLREELRCEGMARM